MDNVWDQVDVALPAAPAGVRAERLLHGKAQEEQLDIVDVELVGGLPLACAFLEVSVVPAGKQNERCEQRKVPGEAQSGRESPLGTALSAQPDPEATKVIT